MFKYSSMTSIIRVVSSSFCATACKCIPVVIYVPNIALKDPGPKLDETLVRFELGVSEQAVVQMRTASVLLNPNP